MELSKITTGVILLVVCAVLFGALVAPTISAVKGDLGVQYENEPGIRGTFTIDGADDYSLVTDPDYRYYKINGQNYNFNQAGLTQIITTDVCRVNFAGHFVTAHDMNGQRFVNVNAQSNTVECLYSAETKTLTINIYSSTAPDATITDTYSYVVSNIIYVNPAGDYVGIDTSGDPDISYYVNDINQIVAGGAYTTGDFDTGFFAQGADVAVQVASYSGSASATLEAVDGFTNLYHGSAYTVSITDGEATETFTPYTVFVPKYVNGHTSSDDMYGVLFSIIPILILVSLVMCAVYFVARGRAD